MGSSSSMFPRSTSRLLKARFSSLRSGPTAGCWSACSPQKRDDRIRSPRGSRRDVKVLVIGNCAIDRSFRLSRLPAAGETVLADGSSDDIGGKGANQAVAAARAGAAVILCSAIGRDEDGARMKSRLCAESVRTEFVFERDGRTDQSVVLVATSGENCIVSSHEMARSIGPEAAADALATLEAGDIL